MREFSPAELIRNLDTVVGLFNGFGIEYMVIGILGELNYIVRV